MSIPSKEMMIAKVEKSRRYFMGHIEDQRIDDETYEFDYESHRELVVLYNRYLGNVHNLKFLYKEEVDLEPWFIIYNTIGSQGPFRPGEEPKKIKLEL